MTEPIEPPSSRLMTHVGLDSTHRGRARRRLVSASLGLTPLVDIMVVLVLFLLVRFSPAAGHT